jgi:hypothetical protein
MNHLLHNLAQSLKDLVDILTSLHVIALLIVNVTRTPYSDKDLGSYTTVNKFYRAIEVMAGLITPLSKR